MNIRWREVKWGGFRSDTFESAGSQMPLWCLVEEYKMYMRTENMSVKLNDHPWWLVALKEYDPCFKQLLKHFLVLKQFSIN